MRSLFLITLCFFITTMQSYSQIVADSIPLRIPFLNNAEVQVVRTDVNTSFEDIKKIKNWYTLDSTYSSIPKTAIWLKFNIENKSNDTLRSYLFSKEHYVTTFQESKKGFEIFRNGFQFLPSERTNKSQYEFTEISLSPFQKSSIYVKLHNNISTVGSKYPSLYSEKGYLMLSKEMKEMDSKPIGFIYFYLIALFTIFIFSLVFWLRLRERLYLYYLGYLLFQLIYGFQVLRPTTATVGNALAYLPEFSAAFFQPAQFIFIGFYIFFITNLLAVINYDKLLAKVLHYLGIFCFVYAIAQFIFNYFFNGFIYGETAFIVVRSIILPLNFFLIFWIIYKVKHPLISYFIVGQTLFFIGALLASYIGYMDFYFVPGHFFNFTQSPNIVFQIGLLAEVFCFSLALGENVFLLQKAKEKTNDKLIAQLKENQLLQGRMNRELDEKVEEKTEELIQAYTKLEIEREQKIKDDFMQRIKESEMMALRSQMNPHFIFNSLSAIKHLIMTARNDDAIVYLDDFSSLLRGILQNSNREKITVEEELEILELYLSLEKNRMETDFKYDIQFSSREALSQYQIPPLLLQPIVENAIWHGLHPSLKSKKRLKIIFDTTDNLKIIIEDNGIGRKESAKKIQLHISLGNKMVQDRLTLYNHLNDHAIQINTTDLEEDGKALGTRITLTYQN